MGILGDMIFGGGLGLFDDLGNSGGCSNGSRGRSVIANPPTYDLVREAIKRSDTEAGKILREVDDAKEEIQELCTTGFCEIVIKGNIDYKTGKEIKEDAEAVISSASRRYQEKSNVYNLCLTEFNDLITELYEIKVKIIKDIRGKAFPIFGRYIKVDDVPCYKYQQSILSKICPHLEGQKKYMDVWGKRKSAEAYFSNAKEYEKNIQAEIEQLDKAIEFLNMIKRYLQEERMVIYAVQTLTERIGTDSQVYKEMLKNVRIMTDEFILDEEGQINVEYVQSMQNLKNMFCSGRD